MGPAILVTLGVLLLMSEMHVVGFDYTWPVLLIVIGVVKVLQGNASTYGHAQQPYPYGYAGYQAPQNPAVPPAATPNPSSNQGQMNQGQVNNG
jgi:hypothetical protein